MHLGAAKNLIAVDIGNSRIKIGQFDRARMYGAPAATQSPSAHSLPEPVCTLDLPVANATGAFDTTRLRAWCDQRASSQSEWLVASVHRRAAETLDATLRNFVTQAGDRCAIRHLTYRDIPLDIQVDEPARVGIDRLLAAFAANRLRSRQRAAVIVDLGTAVTVDLLTAAGAFAGGAILPGIAMSARALAEQTDGLPLVVLDALEQPPSALGKSTVPAIQAGLYWGPVGAIRELVRQLSAGLSPPPEMFVTGGASPRVGELLAIDGDSPVHHVPHLVLAGIALVDASAPCRGGG